MRIAFLLVILRDLRHDRRESNGNLVNLGLELLVSPSFFLQRVGSM